MTVTVHRIRSDWWFAQDVPDSPKFEATRVVHVPEGAAFVDLIDCTRPEVPLQALELPIPGIQDRRFPVNAGVLIEIAEQGGWPDLRISRSFSW